MAAPAPRPARPARASELAALGPLRDGGTRSGSAASRTGFGSWPADAGRAAGTHASAARAATTATSWSSALAAGERRDLAAILEAWLRVRARAAIEREIERHAAALGVSPAAVTVRDARTRWGSCSRARRLSFSWRLVLAPPEALETVVVHELAHLRVFGHGPGFWAIVASRRPDHRRWRRWLRDHSLELHAALDVAADVGARQARPASGRSRR